MALLKLSAPASAISGTIGGVTYSRNKAGTYAKQWGKGSQPDTSWQSGQRSIVSSWPPAWSLLSNLQRAAWDSLAADPPETDYDRFGTVVLLSGYQWFVRISTRQYIAGAAYDPDPPTKVVQAAPVISALYLHAPGGSPNEDYVTFADDEFAPNELAVIFLSFSQSQGNTTGFQNQKWVCNDTPNGNTSTDFTTGAVLRFGYFSAGWLGSVQVFRQSTTGIRSIATVLRATVSS